MFFILIPITSTFKYQIYSDLKYRSINLTQIDCNSHFQPWASTQFYSAEALHVTRWTSTVCQLRLAEGLHGGLEHRADNQWWCTSRGPSLCTRWGSYELANCGYGSLTHSTCDVVEVISLSSSVLLISTVFVVARSGRRFFFYRDKKNKIEPYKCWEI